MPSAFTHAYAAVALGVSLLPEAPRGRLLALGAACAVLPDVDVLAFRFGIPYENMLGHRGFTHSILFAAIMAVVAWSIARRGPVFLFLAALSHGVLDSFTNGGLGVAFFAPFSADRYFFVWRPIVVSPISIHRFFSDSGLAVLKSEFVYVWIPATVVMAVAGLVRAPAKGRG